MRIIAKRPITEFCARHPAASGAMLLWWKTVEAALWENFAQLRQDFNAADSVGDGRVVFDVGGNKYRIIARVSYAPYYRVLIKFVGTHAQYDKIDARTVNPNE